MSGSPPQFENYIESFSAGNPSLGEGVMFLDDDPEVLQYLKSLQKKPKPTEERTDQSHAPEEVDSDSEIYENESTDQETSEHSDENMMPDNNCTDKTIPSPKNKTPSTKVLSDATNKTNKPSLATKQIEQRTSNLQEKEKSLQKSVSPSSQAASNVLQQSNQSSTDHLELNHSDTCCVACQINIDDALEMLRKQNEILLDIAHMQALPTNRTSGNRQDFSLLPKFPLNNPIEIVTFDKNLGNKKIQNQFTEYMTRWGGNNEKDCVRRIMAKFVTDEAAKKFSCTGSSENTIAVGLMTFPKVIESVVQTTFEKVTECEIKKWIAEWLRRCTDRLAAERKRINKRIQQERAH